MSNVEEASILVERNGVTVRKTFEDEDFPVPAIAFDISAEGPGAVDVTITDVVPPDVPAENIGFHPEYGAEFWSIDGDDIVFERRFEPGEEYTTVYGIRPDEVDDLESHLEEPDLETSPAGSLGGSTTGSSIGGVDGEITVDPLDLDEGTGDQVASSGDATTGGTERGEAGDIDAVSDVPHDEPGEAGTATTDSDRIIGALAAEIQAGDVAEEDLRTLRGALFDADPDEAQGSQDARIAHLQSAVSDLRAYTDALEAFLDENGGADAVIDDLRGTVSDLEEEVALLGSRTEETATVADELESDVEDLTADLSALDVRVGTLETDVNEVEETAGDALNTATTVDEDVQELSEALDDLHTDVEDLTDEIATVREEVDTSGDADERLADMEEDVDSIRGELEELSEMRDRMASIFGAPGSDQDAADPA